MESGGEVERAREIVRQARKSRPGSKPEARSRREIRPMRLVVLLAVAAGLLAVLLLWDDSSTEESPYRGPGDRVVAATLMMELRAFRDSTGRYPEDLDEIGASDLPRIDYSAGEAGFRLAVGDSMRLDESSNPGMVALPPGVPRPDAPSYGAGSNQ